MFGAGSQRDCHPGGSGVTLLGNRLGNVAKSNNFRRGVGGGGKDSRLGESSRFPRMQPDLQIVTVVREPTRGRFRMVTVDARDSRAPMNGTMVQGWVLTPILRPY